MRIIKLILAVIVLVWLLIVAWPLFLILAAILAVAWGSFFVKVKNLKPDSFSPKEDQPTTSLINEDKVVEGDFQEKDNHD